jgi:hypothetical protein
MPILVAHHLAPFALSACAMLLRRRLVEVLAAQPITGRIRDQLQQISTEQSIALLA